MKFSNGCWLEKEGYACFAPQEVYSTSVEENGVVLYTPTTPIRHRGDTLGGINLTLVISVPFKEVIRVQVYHHKGVMDKEPHFELNIEKNHLVEVEDKEESICIRSGALSLTITKKNFSMVYERNGAYLTSSGWKDLAYMKTDWKGFAYDKGNPSEAYIYQQLKLSVGEYIYGLGERFTPFIKNGQSIDIWNNDGGTSTEQSYKNIPFYVSNKGYGIFVNHPEKVSFEIGSEKVSKVGFSVPGEKLDYFFINGPSMKEVLMHYTDLTGKPSLPAPWTFGLWLSTSFTTNYDEETVMEFVDGMLERGIPLSVFHFDCFWMKAFHWSDFVWDHEVFPDPEGLLRRLKAKGLRICVWINPYIAQESVLFKEGKAKGYFIKRINGDVWQWDMWQPGMAIVDFTNPEACKWFAGKLEKLLDMGVDCFKTDFGERIPVDVVYHDGSDPMKMHNYYTYLYNKVVYGLLEAKRGTGEAILFARSATAGGQKFPVHWGGDCWSDYESMGESLRGGLSLMMSGFGYWSHDIGGFESTSTADVYKRWAAFGLLSSHSRLHGSTSYRVPWAYDEEAVDVVRFFTKLKMKLMPYLYKSALETSKLGIPMMRSMLLEFEKDLTCPYLDRQYMLGDSLLVAPILNDRSQAIYYLPEGTWTSYLTGQVVDGGRWIEEIHDYKSIPLFVRENSIVPVSNQDDRPEYDYLENVELRVYALKDVAKIKVYTMDQQEMLYMKAIYAEDEIKIQVDASRPYSIRLVNEIAKDVEGVKWHIEGKDTVLEPRPETLYIVVKL